MGLIEKSDVRKLLQDPELSAEIAKAVVADPKTLDSLADDIADELSDELEDDPEMRRRIVDARWPARSSRPGSCKSSWTT